MKKAWQAKLQQFQAERFGTPNRAPSPKQNWHSRLRTLQETRQVPPPPQPVAPPPPSLMITPNTIAVVAHGFDAHDGLSKVAGSLLRGFQSLGWRTMPIVANGAWWQRIPADTEITLIAVFPNAIPEPQPGQVRGRLLRYTMYEHPTVPADWVSVLNRADRVFVTLPVVREAMRASGVRSVESVGFGWEMNFPHAFKPTNRPRERIGCLSVAGRRKGMLELVAGFRVAKAQRPNLKLHIHSRVTSERELSAALSRLECEVPGFVFTERDLSPTELESWWQALDGYALTSIGEGLSMTPREAISRGIPCVLSEIEAHEELINHGWAIPASSSAESIGAALVKLHDDELPDPKPLRARPWRDVASEIAREPETVFYWCQMSARCGVAEYVRHLKSVAKNASDCGSTLQLGRAKHAVLVLMPGYGDKIHQLRASIARLRASGTRVTLDVHHLNSSNTFAELFPLVDDVIWHHPRSPHVARVGRYVPLPVPVVPKHETRFLGGIVHFGIWAPNKRIDIMARVAERLQTQLYIYGHNNVQALASLPGHLRPRVYIEDSFPDESRLSDLLRQHAVGMIGRAPWHGQGYQLHGAASPRFFLAAGLPAVIDRAEPHEDLTEALDVVSYDDFESVVSRVARLMHDQDYRAQALARGRAYAESCSPRVVAQTMGICV